MARVITVEELRAAVGTEVAVSGWYPITQTSIDEFADAIHDAQWIHVDSVRAARESPFRDEQGVGQTVAHGFLTLSLLSHLLESSLEFAGRRAGVNVGFNRIRWVAPVLSGTRVRARFALAACADIASGLKMTWDVTVERERHERPALTAQWLTRVLY
jgi:acyl dehydratase